MPVLPGLWVEAAYPPCLHTLCDVPQSFNHSWALSTVSTSLLSCELPLNAIFQQCTGNRNAVLVHQGSHQTLRCSVAPGGEAHALPITPKATKGFPSKGSSLPQKTRAPCPSSCLLRSGGHVTVFGPRWASVLSAQHSCHRKGGCLQPTGPYVHQFKHQSTSATSSEILATYCSDVNRQKLTKQSTRWQVT